jgi:solute carrier family 3 protein 2
MTKEELMKYANDPFWVKLRWVLFIFFWLLWIAMLLGAIAIIIYAPKCAAPTPLAWFKKGPLAKIDNENVQDEVVNKMRELNVQGVVYELPSQETYNIDVNVENRIRGLVQKFKSKDIEVVVDLTPNYVTKDDELFKDALKEDAESIKAFVTSDKGFNWKKVNSEEPAWKKEGKLFFLNQFNDFYDIRMDNPKAQQKLTDTITKLADLGVKGFRLANTKYFIISENLEDEKLGNTIGNDMKNYSFYSHKQTTYNEGLGDLIQLFAKHVYNVTNGDGFLTIQDDLSSHASIFKPSNQTEYGFELQRFGFITHEFKTPNEQTATKIYNQFNNLKQFIDETFPSIWMQLQYSKATYENFESTAFKMFISLLRGVLVANVDDLLIDTQPNSTEMYKKIESARESPVFQHGSFDYFLSRDNSSFAYAR